MPNQENYDEETHLIETETNTAYSDTMTEKESQIIKQKSQRIKDLEERLEELQLTSKIEKAQKRDMRGTKIIIGASVIGAFIAVSFFFFFYIFSDAEAEFNVSAVLSIIAGSFAAFLIMAITGTIKEFSIKSPIFEMASKIEEKIEEVQDDVENSKNEVNDKLSTLNQNLQAITTTIQNVAKSTSESSAYADQKQATHIVNNTYQDISGMISTILNQSGLDIKNPIGETKVPLYVTDQLDRLREIQKKLGELVTSDKQNFDINAVLNEAYILSIEGKYEEAVPKYRQVLRVDPDNVIALNRVGNAFRALKKSQTAISYFDKAIEIDPKPVIALVGKGMVLCELGEYEEAKSCYKEAIQIDIESNDLDGLMNRGIAYERLENLEKAIEVFEDVLRSDPNHLRALDNRGVTLARLGRYEDAIHDFDKATASNPNYVNALYNKSCVLYHQGKVKESFELLEKVVELSPLYKKTAKNDSETFGKMKDEERKHFEEIVI